MSGFSKYIILFFSSLLFLGVEECRSSHIIGGEIAYTRIGADQYKITLKVYRDCEHGIPPFDSQASIGIFDSMNNYIRQELIPFPGSVHLEPKLTNPCATIPEDICVEEAVYEAVIFLPPRPGGYQFTYQRCCRNETINNILRPDSSGASYTISMNDASMAGLNSSPIFKNFPPILICKDNLLVFDHSANDIDGDSLVYSLCKPYVGAEPTEFGAMPQPPMAPPYDFIDWKYPYSESNFLGGVPLKIDSKTGLLTAVPGVEGQFVVGVCVKEYRKGILLSTNKRDFQFNVRECPPIPTAALFPSINSCGDKTVKFKNYSKNALSYEWDFDINSSNDTVLTTENPSHTYPKTGTYKVRLIAKGSSCSDTVYSTININPGIKANFNVADKCEMEPASFIQASTVDSGKVVMWDWDYGDGNQGKGVNPLHAYAKEGYYNVKLIATSDKDCRDTIIKSIRIYDTPEPAFSNTTGCDNSPINFKDSTTINDDSILTWLWNFGDGTTSSSANPQHAFSYQNSPYSISLKTISMHGCTKNISKTISIHPLPEVDFAAPNACQFISDTLKDLSTISEGLISKWKWNFENDSTNTLQNVIYAFQKPGLNNVSLTAVSEHGCKGSTTKSITIFPKPKADFYFTRQCLNYLNNFFDSSTVTTNDLVSWNWNFDDGFSSVQKNASRVYQKDGIYHVTHTVSTGNGCIDSITKKVNVFPAPDARFTGTKMEGCPPFTTVFSPNDTLDIEGTYLWDFGDGTFSNEMKPTHEYKITDKKLNKYTVSLLVISSQGCMDTSMSPNPVTVLPLPTADFTHTPHATSLYLPQITFNNFSKDAEKWQWNFGDNSESYIENPKHSYSDTGYFNIVLTAINSAKCSDTATGRIYIKPIFTFFIANTFSPDHNNHNDIFYGYGAGIKQYQFMIFDRWGEKVFETNKLNEGWDGTTNGMEAPQDTYVYHILLTDIFKRQHKYTGIVNLIR